jgi:catechol 2,3-dioxygenase-like lactoylglutathione lyase family enzyme
MSTAIRHVGLVVADLERSLKFWCETMGFVVSRQMEESGPHIDAIMGLKGVRVTTAKLAAPDGNLIELLKFHSHPDRPTWSGTPYSTGFTHIALTVECLDELLPRLIVAGAKVPSPPQVSPDGKVKVLYVKGLDDILIELVESLEA